MLETVAPVLWPLLWDVFWNAGKPCGIVLIASPQPMLRRRTAFAAGGGAVLTVMIFMYVIRMNILAEVAEMRASMARLPQTYAKATDVDDIRKAVAEAGGLNDKSHRTLVSADKDIQSDVAALGKASEKTRTATADLAETVESLQGTVLALQTAVDAIRKPGFIGQISESTQQAVASAVLKLQSEFDGKLDMLADKQLSPLSGRVDREVSELRTQLSSLQAQITGLNGAPSTRGLRVDADTDARTKQPEIPLNSQPSSPPTDMYEDSPADVKEKSPALSAIEDVVPSNNGSATFPSLQSRIDALQKKVESSLTANQDDADFDKMTAATGTEAAVDLGQ